MLLCSWTKASAEAFGPILTGQQKEMQFLSSRVHSPEILKILKDWKTIPLSKLLAAALGTVASILHSLPSTSKTQSLWSGKEWRHTMQQAVQHFSQGQELSMVGHRPATYQLLHKSLPSLSNRWSLVHHPSRVDSFPAEIKDRRTRLGDALSSGKTYTVKRNKVKVQ